MEESRDKEVTHYYVLRIELNGDDVAVAVSCVPDDKGFQMKVLVRSPIPQSELPVVVSDEIKEWIEDVRKDYHQSHLMSLP